MPKIEIRVTNDPVYPFSVIEAGRTVDAFASYQAASNYRDDLKKWHRAKKAVDA